MKKLLPIALALAVAPLFGGDLKRKQKEGVELNPPHIEEQNPDNSCNPFVQALLVHPVDIINQKLGSFERLANDIFSTEAFAAEYAQEERALRKERKKREETCSRDEESWQERHCTHTAIEPKHVKKDRKAIKEYLNATTRDWTTNDRVALVAHLLEMRNNFAESNLDKAVIKRATSFIDTTIAEVQSYDNSRPLISKWPFFSFREKCMSVGLGVLSVIGAYTVFKTLFGSNDAAQQVRPIDQAQPEPAYVGAYQPSYR